MQERFDSFIQSAKHAVILLVIAGLGTQGFLLLRHARQRLDEIAVETKGTMAEIRRTSEIIRVRAEEDSKQYALLADQSKNLVRIIDNGLLFSRTINREFSPEILAVLKSIRQETLPRINLILTDSHDLIVGLVRNADELEKLFPELKSTIEEIRRIITDKNIKTALESAAQISKNIEGITADVQASSDDVRRAIPEILDALKMVAANTDKSTEEIARFLARLNRNPTKKERLVSFLLRVISASGPTLTEVLRRQ